ncbi:AsnC family transcriptional regulator [Marinomonas sp. S3726]|uniref:Lrp/AsnC family transcriptional regulator n=1 Tax=Marinomonas sp. S3726 TaxID=579484 RepID=UPI0005F9AADC|nr:Lrp/AsnC family transcriptional regulator [Marinomonas sp. S3726]KJZ13718.1 AsnC family transcriptional regulator [Marinomonas sp. S3726]
MDELNRKMLALLQLDGRMSIADLANALKVSRATVKTRLDRLVAEGEITGFSVQLKSALSPHAVRAVMMLEIEGKPSNSLIVRLRAMPEVLAVHSTNGRWDFIVEIGTESLESFDHTIKAIRLLDSVSLSETSIKLTTHKSHD